MPTSSRKSPRNKRRSKPASRSSTTAAQSPTPPAARRPDYLKKASARGEFRGATTLAAAKDTVEELTNDDRKLIVEQALILIEQNYAHLPHKRAMHAIDPVQRLRLLRQELDVDPSPFENDLAFHGELTDIFTSLRDLHTTYQLPLPYANLTAFLPFMVEECYDKVKGEFVRKYVVSRVFDLFKHPHFVKGVEIVQWNGVPIERAIRNHAQKFAGSNPEARRARGVQMLTTRALKVDAPPDEEWVIVGYRTRAGVLHEHRFEWVTKGADALTEMSSETNNKALAAFVGVDLRQQLIQSARTSLFGRHARQATIDAAHKVALGESLDELESEIPEVLEARRVITRSGTFGYIRLRSFMTNPALVVNEFTRLLAALPREGLIIDVRGNGGGIIMSGEYLLQLLTPHPIEPEPAQFINSPLNLRICNVHGGGSAFTNLSPWTPSMIEARRTGAAFSAGYPISDPVRCNDVGQRYFGPVVLITDALCYSTTDIFAAGFQDHNIGKVLGTHGNTGAGGANVWQHSVLAGVVLPDPDSGYQPLPRGAGLSVSIRRTLRVGKRAGTPVEDLGVRPDEFHRLTPNDVLGDNQDLKNKAGELLRQGTVRHLSVRPRQVRGRRATLQVTVLRMDRIDVYLGDRPIDSLENPGRKFEIEVVARAPDTDVVELRGYDGEELVARFRVRWREIMESAPAHAESRRNGTARRRKATGKRTRAARAAQPPSPTPNAGDDADAAREITPTAFGGPALAGDQVAAATGWRAAESLLMLRKQVNAMAPGRNKASDGMIGDAAHASRDSDHNPWVREGSMGIVTACDITHDPSGGCDADVIAEAIRAGRDTRVKYIIWNRRIANSSAINGTAPWTWRPYGGSNPHTKHVHISVKPDKSSYDSVAAWPL